MTTRKMHDDEIDIDEVLVRRLVAAQFPRWRELPVTAVPSSGTDNAMYRLGPDMAVRLPRRPVAALQVAKEQLWLPRMAPRLPAAIPVPLARGAPQEGYPFDWSVCRWVTGETLLEGGNGAVLAQALARFICALREIDTTGAPRPGQHNFGRGEPLIRRDGITRRSIAALEGEIDTTAVVAAWDADSAAAAWHGAPVWVHGDLSAANLLAKDGTLCGVIDFGGLAIGDPAADIFVAWSLFDRDVRGVFRAVLDADDASWARGRGWALALALVAMPYYRQTNPPLVARARHVIGEILADHRDEG
ncbi:MAG: aminoglycoside phosphotransferase family protein [Alphaproteobacteria bacterium]|nr:aminoglycoside phosphotransferase family protein [Alphaproteobacteria bacterium]MBL7098103.1 aminoglycoside phosphotransferase family protein [Alphaproteobacteria bacterium]